MNRERCRRFEERACTSREKTMATDPVSELLPDKTEQAEMYRKLGEFAALLRETVAWGTHLMKWCLQGAAGGDEQVPPQMLFRRVVELIDSMTTQFEGGSVAPAKITLRALFEAHLGLLYLLERDTDERAFAFLVTNLHRELKFLDRMDPSSAAGKQLRAEIADDKLIQSWTLPVSPTLQLDRAHKQKMLAMPGYAAAEQAYQAARAKKRPFDWYSLHGGPRNVRELAKHLRELLLLSKTDDGEPAVVQLRLPRDAQVMTLYTMEIALETYRRFAEGYTTTGESATAAWYMENIQAAFMALGGEEQIKIED
jgi:hypothetical protein